MPVEKQFAFHRICPKSPSPPRARSNPENRAIRVVQRCRQGEIWLLQPPAPCYDRAANSEEICRIATIIRGAGRRFIDSLKMLYHVADIGDARSLAIHPATTTHSQLSQEDLAATGVTEGYVRLSIGIEHPDDIIADIGQALDAVS